MASSVRQALVEQLVESLARPLRPFTPRRVFGRTGLPGKATAVTGMRRAGKTTFLHQLRRERVEGGVARDLLPFVSFEDERLAGLEATELGALVDEYYRRKPQAHDATVTWCFDEIQLVPGWERFVRRLLDAGGSEVLITGSSAALLSREIATALRGRAWQVLIHPFAFAEALHHRGLPVPEPGNMTRRERSHMERALFDWLHAGGFPEAQGLDAESRHQLYRDYVDVAVLRDVVERHQVRNMTALRWLVRHLLGNAGSTFSVEKFHAALRSQGLPVARDTLHEYLAYLEDCYLARLVWMESTSERQRMVNPRKAYPVDPGLIPVFDRSGRANVGHALETAVLIELERRRSEVTYVRTPEGYEVDFLARDGTGGMELIQVCADASDAATATRELRALASAGRRFPRAGQRLITLTGDAVAVPSPPGTTVTAAAEWFLAPYADAQAAGKRRGMPAVR